MFDIQCGSCVTPHVFTESSPVQTKADKERLRRQQLKMIKKKFGLAVSDSQLY